VRTINEIIDEQPLSRFQTITIILCGLVLFLDGFDTQSIGFLVPPISEELKIPISSFGPVFGAGLLGLMFGTMLGGPIADRWGRRWAIIGSTIAFGIFSLLTTTATTADEFVTFRFLTGLGLGGAMPNVVALATEYAPSRLQSTLVTMMFGGMGAGALVSGLAGSALMPVWGWRAVLYLGGGLPLLLAVLLVVLLPESVRFLIVRGRDSAAVSPILKKISPDFANISIKPSPKEPVLEGLAVKHLFRDGRAVGTLLLWVPYFMNLLLMYFILSWMPALLRQAGMPVSAGVAAVSAFSLGNVMGASVQGRLMTVLGATRVLLAEFIGCVFAMAILGQFLTSYGLMLALTWFLGVCCPGAQAGLNALAAAFYPTAIRSTGVGWALGIGRIGSIVGPTIGGMMLGWGWAPQQIFLSGVIPAVIAASALVLSSALRHTASAYRPQIPASIAPAH